MSDNTLGNLNDVMFEELRRLSEVDVSDRDALDAEISRAKAMEGIAGKVIDNAETIMEATAMRAKLTAATVDVPRMLVE